MAMNIGMIQAVKELVEESKLDLEIRAHEDSIYAGAIGAAIWGGFRHYKLMNEKVSELK
jgi:benzoyl-CoA reductase subunit D